MTFLNYEITAHFHSGVIRQILTIVMYLHVLCGIDIATHDAWWHKGHAGRD